MSTCRTILDQRVRVALNKWTNILQVKPAPFGIIFSLKDLLEGPTKTDPKKGYTLLIHVLRITFIYAKSIYCQVISFLQDHLPFGLLPGSAIDLRLTKPSQAFWDRRLDTGEIKVRTVFDNCLQDICGLSLLLSQTSANRFFWLWWLGSVINTFSLYLYFSFYER